MSKAEERAFERYPDYREMDGEYVTQIHKRKVFAEGYQQAEKDVAESFAKIIRGNLSMMDKSLQYKFEQLYTDVIGEKMYKGFKD
jgi:hypothetical protein